MLLLHIPKKCSGKTIQQLLLLFFLLLSFYRLAQALEDQMLQSVPWFYMTQVVLIMDHWPFLYL